MTTTAIIGTGNIGSRLAANLIKGGADVLVASRDDAGAKELADSLGTHAEATTVADAIERADVVVLAVWFDSTKQLLAEYREQLRGKIVVDPSNPIAPDGNGGFAKTIGAQESSGVLVAGLLAPETPLVKAFGTLSADSLGTAAHQTPPVVGFYAADDEAAATTVAGLITAAGFDPVRVGGIDSSIRIEVFGDLHEFGGLGHPVTRAQAEAALTPSA